MSTSRYPKSILGFTLYHDGTIEKRWGWRGFRTSKLPRSPLRRVIVHYSARGRVVLKVLAEDWNITMCWDAASESILKQIAKLDTEAQASIERGPGDWTPDPLQP